MEIFLTAVNWVWTNIFSSAALFMGVLIIVGQLACKKKFIDALCSGLKGYIGYLVFNVATSAFSSTFRPILNGLRALFNVTLTVNDSYYGLSAQKQAFADAGGNDGLQGMILVVAIVIMVLMVLFRKVTKMRAFPIQGHLLTNTSLGILLIIFLIRPGASNLELIIICGVIMALRLMVPTNFAVEAAQDLTDGSGIVVGHAQMFADRIAWEIGKKIEKKSLKKTGKKPKHLDDLQLPGWLRIFDDVYVSCFLIMFVFFGIIMLILGEESMHEIDASFKAGSSFLMYIVGTAAKFPLNLVILFAGLRMFVAEITDAFTGLTQGVLKGVLPGIDIAAFFGYCGNPNIITASFLCGTLIMLAMTILGVLLNAPVIVMMGFTQMMFDNAGAGMFGHHRGGIKGLICGTALTGIVDPLFGGLVAWVYGLSTTVQGVAAPFDQSIMMSTVGLGLKYLGIAGLVIWCVIMIAIPQIQYALCKDKEAYWLAATDWEEYKRRMLNDDAENTGNP